MLSDAVKPRYMSVNGIVAQESKEVGKITFADITVDPADIGLKGSPTKVKSTATKQFDDNREILELDPVAAAKTIVDALDAKHLI